MNTPSFLLTQFVAATLFLMCPTATVAPHGVIWTLIIVGILGICHHGFWPSLTKLNQYHLITALGAFSCWIMLGTVGEYGSVKSGLKILGIIFLSVHSLIFFKSFDRRQVNYLLSWFSGGMALALVFLFLDHQLGDLWLHWRNVSSAKAFAHTSQVFALSYWPIALFIAKSTLKPSSRLIAMASVLAIVSFILMAVDCDAGIVSLIVGVFCGCLALIFPRFTLLSIRVSFPLVVIASPLVALWYFTPEYISWINKIITSQSYLHRLHIWNNVAVEWLKSPFFGYGMDSTRVLASLLGNETWSMVSTTGEVISVPSEKIALHPHNLALQLFLELGIVGVLVFLYLMHTLFRHIKAKMLDPRDMAFTLGTFGTAIVIAWISVGIWQSWWLSSLFIVTALTAMLLQSKGKEA